MDARFHWADYLVFAGSLVLSMGIGVWFACTGKKVSTTDEFLMAGRKMPVFPVSMSMFVSWLSAISFLGDPVEVYTYGSVYIFLGVGYCLSLPFIAHFFTAKYHKLGLVSIYEFLEDKYNKGIRLLAATLSIAITESWLAVVLYAPSLALSQVSGIPVWVSIVSIGGVCTFYTTIGGMKAVLWADTVQMVIMVAGLLAVAIQGSIRIGGFGEIWRIAAEGGRINFLRFDPNPLLRASFWTGLVGGYFRVLNPYVGTQFLVQRYSTVATAREAKLVVYWNLPMFALLSLLFWIIGLVMYAVYHDCDPVASGRIQLADQMVPLLVIDLLSFMPGIPGLFIACVFSASLSSLSSGFNGSAAVILKDFITPLYEHCKQSEMPDKLQTTVSKALAVLFGALTLCLAFVIMWVGSSIFALSTKITGMFGGPVASVFICGILLPKLGNAGVMCGFALSLIISMWTGIGGLFIKPIWVQLPVSTEGCLDNASLLVNLTMTTPEVLTTSMDFTTTALDMANSTAFYPTGTMHTFQLSDIYSLSPLIYGPLTTTIGVVGAALFHSIFTCAQRICCQQKYTSLRMLKRESSIIPYKFDEDLPDGIPLRRPAVDPRQWGIRQSEVRSLMAEELSMQTITLDSG